MAWQLLEEVCSPGPLFTQVLSAAPSSMTQADTGLSGPAEPAVEALKAANDPSAAEQALRVAKNQLIGNKHKKAAFFQQGAVSAIFALASTYRENAVWVQAAAALASLAYNLPQAVSEIQTRNGIELLIQMLAASDAKVAENASRALRISIQVPFPPHPMLDCLAPA